MCPRSNNGGPCSQGFRSGAHPLYRYLRRKFMNDKQRLMIEGMDRLLRRFNKYPNDKEFTVEEIIEVSNEIYDEIVKEEN